MSRDLAELDEDVRAKALLLLDHAAERGIGLKVTQTYRTFAEQAALYAQGRSTPGPIVTHADAGWSWHNWRRAFDVCFVDSFGGVSWAGPWDEVGALGEAAGLDWGGRWKHPDRPHFEDRAGLTLAKLRAKYPVGLSERQSATGGAA